MFNALKVNIFYNKLKKEKFITKDYFDIIDNELKTYIIKDSRFAEFIKLGLIIKEKFNEETEEHIEFIDNIFIENLTDENLIILFEKIISSYQRVNLSNLFIFLKDKYITTTNETLKDNISKLLYKSSLNINNKLDYIGDFINLFDDNERIKLFENKYMINFVTVYTEGINPYYGYSDFLEIILNNINNNTVKYNILIKIFDFLPKKSDVKNLYLRCIIEKLDKDYIVNLLNKEEIIEEYKYKGDSFYNSNELLTIVNMIDNIDLKKNIITNYFGSYEFIYNIISNRELPNEKISGDTIKCFYDLNMLSKEYYEKLIMEYCIDENLFEMISKYENKKEKLLNISNKVNMELLLNFTKENNIDIFNDEFAKKFFNSDEYFSMLPKEKSHLIKYYIGENEELFFNKLNYCKNKRDIILKSYFNIDFDKLKEFAKINNIDLYDNEFLKKYKNNTKYFENLPPDQSHLIYFYNGINLELFFNKLELCRNKINILLNNNLKVEDEKVLKKALDKNYLSIFDKKIIQEIIKIKDKQLKKIFKEFLLDNYDSIPENTIYIISELLNRIYLSNSLEVTNFKTEIAMLLLHTDKPIENFNKIEEIFLKNNLPKIGKIYSVFEILHPDFSDFDFSEKSKISPKLKNKSNFSRKIIIFSDLLKVALGSNNRSIKNYLKNLELGNELYKNLLSAKLNYNELNEDNQLILKIYIEHLVALYNNTQEGKKEQFNLSNNIEEDVNLISKIYKDVDDLPNKIVRMFCHFAGFDTIDELKRYMAHSLKEKENRNKRNKFILENGDLIKGIDSVKHLENILQNGSVSKEYLGAYSKSDETPLDTDVSKILECKDTLEETINLTSSKKYGDFWLVLKNDERFNNFEKNKGKYELFYTGITGNDHYGIRTGFSSTDIDFIISAKNDSRIGLSIALNDFYIPVIDLQGNLIFSEQDYMNIRSKMSGLSYYDNEEYSFSENLINDDIKEISSLLTENNKITEKKKGAINCAIKKTADYFSLELKTFSDGNLNQGTIELIDIGSTGRHTNVFGAGDFDFVIKLDRNILLNKKLFDKFKNVLRSQFVSIEVMEEPNGNFRYKGVTLKGLDEKVDIDITFTQKTNKIEYSTDECLKDRLLTMFKQDSEKYKLAISNILLAKNFLKSKGIYKPIKSPDVSMENGIKYGGLGGIGIENWILQNGGSFIDAINSFLNASEGKTFEEFKKTYYIWDFGKNYLSIDRNDFPYDNYIYNMNNEGYNKMRMVLKEYINNIKVDKKNNFYK